AEFPLLGQNLFVNLATKIAEELNVSDCWICGGPLMTKEWPWKGASLSALDIIQWNHTATASGIRRPDGWVLSSVVIGQDCLKHRG
ncbi:ENR1 protein, partial [Calyptomena viridis]|nr:ENR1 protein [Calyptomena viridis]